MTDILTRAAKASPLEHSEMDGNFLNLKAATEQNATDIASEIQNRINAINAEVLNRDAAILVETNNRVSAITGEVTARNNAISTAIATEVSARNAAIAADAVIRTNNFNTAINDAISLEENARISADALEVTARNAAIGDAITAILGGVVAEGNTLNKLYNLFTTFTGTVVSTLSIVDNLITADASVPLSANQGYVLSQMLFDETNFRIAEDDLMARKTTTINGHSLENDIILLPADLNLGNVDNTTDINKPISNATQTALNQLLISANDYTLVKSTEVYDAAVTVLAPLSHVGSNGSDQHAVVTEYVAGFMSFEDKVKLNAITGTNTGDQTDISGNAHTATLLQTTRRINGVDFNGSEDITINAVDSTPRVATSELGVTVATLVNGTVPANQLPSYVDDVQEFANLASFPVTGEAGKIYVDKATNKTYRWSGSVYVYITSGAVDSVNGHTGIVVLNKTDVGLNNVDNTNDVDKPVSTAQAAADTIILNSAKTYTDTETSRAVAAEATLVPKTTTVNGHALSGNVVVTAADVGLGSVNDTSDINKPVSTAQQTAINNAITTAASDATTKANAAQAAAIAASAPLSHVGSSGTSQHAVATTSVAGFMSAADKTKLDSVASGANVGTVTNVTGTAPINVANNTSTPAISISPASTSAAGSMSASDKTKLDGISANAAALSSTAPVALGAAAAVGVATVAARGDHVHPFPTKANVGLGNVDNTSDANKPISTATQSALDGKVNTNALGVSVATLVNGTVPASQLPGYVDDVVEYSDLASFPAIGESGVMYVALDTGKVYRWSGSTYTIMIASPGTTDAVVEGSVNKYFTDARARAAVTTITGNAGTATKLATAITISVSGDATGSASFDGSANAAIATTLATVNSNVGSFGSSTNIPVITVNAKGLVTAVSTQTVNIVSAFSGLTDVSLSSLANGNIPVYNSTTSKWENRTLAAAGIQPTLGAGSVTNAMLANAAVANLSGTNTGDETNSTIITKLGFTPYNATNPSNYQTAAQVSAATVASAAQLTGAQLNMTITGKQASMSMSQDGGATVGSFICKATGTGDANLAGMAFWNDAYAIKLGVRADGYIGIGGWSRAAWSWYSDPSGNMVAAGNVTAYSDPRLKENFKRIQKPMDILNKLDGGTFTWKHGFVHTECKAGKRDYGVLANQVESVMPEIVTSSIEIDGESYKTVSYEKFAPVLIEATKEHDSQIMALQAEVAELKLLVQQLMNR